MLLFNLYLFCLFFFLFYFQKGSQLIDAYGVDFDIKAGPAFINFLASLQQEAFLGQKVNFLHLRDYKFFSQILRRVLTEHFDRGIVIKDSLSFLLVQAKKELASDRKYLRVLRETSLEFTLLWSLKFLFFLFSIYFLEEEFKPIQGFILALQFSLIFFGPFFLQWPLAYRQRYYFELGRSLLLLESYLKLSWPINKVLASFKEELFVIPLRPIHQQRLEYCLEVLETKGPGGFFLLESFKEQIWCEKEDSFETFINATSKIKFFLILVFFLLPYFFEIWILLGRSVTSSDHGQF